MVQVMLHEWPHFRLDIRGSTRGRVGMGDITPLSLVLHIKVEFKHGGLFESFTARNYRLQPSQKQQCASASRPWRLFQFSKPGSMQILIRHPTQSLTLNMRSAMV